ncbi:MAG: hypothetical protein HYX69_01095 [Planctomycetia bacterium]|nr:hypothetical protein [Planctomycetia bacterium]
MSGQIQKLIGGTIKEIRPARGTFLGNFNGIPTPKWGYHTVVVKDGRVYDALTGHQGMAIDEYKKLWDYASDINFGF